LRELRNVQRVQGLRSGAGPGPLRRLLDLPALLQGEEDSLPEVLCGSGSLLGSLRGSGSLCGSGPLCGSDLRLREVLQREVLQGEVLQREVLPLPPGDGLRHHRLLHQALLHEELRLPDLLRPGLWWLHCLRRLRLLR
jgi:hypothetical protein